MKFKDLPYNRIDIKEYQNKQSTLINKINKTVDHNELKNLINTYNINYIDAATKTTLAEVRHTIDTNDKFYADEYNYICEITPLINDISNKYNLVLLNHSEKEYLVELLGQYYFTKLETEAKTFNDSVIDLLVLETKLVNQYDTIIANAKIEFDGRYNNLSQMAKYGQNLDREIRKNAAIAVDNFYAQNDDEIGKIYDELVKVRDQIAKKLGYKNYIELGYLRLNRTDYNADLVSKFRELIKTKVVPIANELYIQQAKRINITNPYMYDYSLNYLDGDPTPKSNNLVQEAYKMYSEMSNETKEFFAFMKDNDLMDLETKPGKMSGGYCTDFLKYNSPFIFANFNSTSDDVNTLTHEAGHAFEFYYASKFIDNKSLISPTLETCEIHSMSMEFFAYPWLNYFFKEDTNKYKHLHLTSTITFLPYAVAVDHFQHLVYENPNATPNERKEIWHKLEQIYLPWRNYGECSFTATGTYWYRQGHIFSSPFYYIDYALAQICALEFYLLDLDSHQDAWQKYLKLCSLGGTDSFLSLIKKVGIASPFLDETITNILSKLLPIIGGIKL